MNAEELKQKVLSIVKRRVLVEHEGAAFELLEPSMRQREEYLRRLEVEGTTVKGSVSEACMYLVIQNTVEPGTDIRVFAESHKEILLNTPGGGLLDLLSSAAVSFLIKKATVEQGKGSAETTTSK